MMKSLPLALAAIGAAYLLYPSGPDEPLPTPPAYIGPAVAAAQFGPGLAMSNTAGHSAAPARTPVFAVDRNGELILGPDTTIALDVLLTQFPERPDREDMARLEGRIKEGLRDRAARDAERFLRAYLAYRKGEAEIEAQPRAATSEAVLEQIIALRRQHFGAQLADALFAAREEQSRFDIQAARIKADPVMNFQEKTARLEALRTKMHGAAVLEEDKSAGSQALRATAQQVALLRERGAPESEIRQLRERALGPGDAQFLSDMETQQAEWEQRYQAFRQQKAAILNAATGEQTKWQSVEALLRRHYKEEEIQNARAYDQEYGQPK
jgi:lipase chaperone LimK